MIALGISSLFGRVERLWGSAHFATSQKKHESRTHASPAIVALEELTKKQETTRHVRRFLHVDDEPRWAVGAWLHRLSGDLAHRERAVGSE